MARALTAERRTTTFYFTYFMGPGAAVMFLPIWLSEKGITPEQIGLINAVPVFAILALNLVVGRIADRARDWRQAILIGALIGGIVPIGLFFVNEFWGILLFWTLACEPTGVTGPVLDAATMRLTRRNGSDFGAIRAWGTIGFMLFNGLTGYLVAWYGSGVFVPLFVGLTLLRALAALQLPAFRAPAEEPTLATLAQPVPALRAPGRLRAVLQPWFLLPLIGFCFIYAAHYIFNAFAALVWKGQGVGEEIIGPLIALGSASEALMMFAWQRFGGRVSARQLMLIAAAAGLVRWSAMAMEPSVPVLIALQMGHGITFAIGYLGCVHFIANWTSEDIAAETQSLFTVGQQLTSVITVIGFGALIPLFGAQAFFASAGLAFIGGAFVWLSLRMKPPKDEMPR